MTINDVLDDYRKRHDFNKRIGPLINVLLVNALVEYFNNDSIRGELGQCSNINQHMNVIEQRTKALSIHRTDEDIRNFKKNFDKLIKAAKL